MFFSLSLKPVSSCFWFLINILFILIGKIKVYSTAVLHLQPLIWSPWKFSLDVGELSQYSSTLSVPHISLSSCLW